MGSVLEVSWEIFREEIQIIRSTEKGEILQREPKMTSPNICFLCTVDYLQCGHRNQGHPTKVSMN